MKRSNKEIDSIIDRVTSVIRNDEPDRTIINQAASRVHESLTTEPAATAPTPSPIGQIKGCSGFQALIPEYMDGSLSPARITLLEDHTHECVPCRKAFKEARLGIAAPAAQPVTVTKRTSSPRWRVAKYAFAASLVIAVGVGAYIGIQRFSMPNVASPTVVNPINGILYLISENETRPLSPGEKLQGGERLRSDSSPGAEVSLADGSRVELDARTQFFVTENPEGITVHLERGSIIVQAAKQGQRHLYVKTDDCLVSVTGTIFSVNTGVKGSRVSVVEGEVHVDNAGEDKVLHPGDQVATNPIINAVPVQEEISWSRNADRYSKLLSELASLRKEVDEKVTRPAARYSTRLLDIVPDSTVLYVGIPNLSNTLGEAHRILQERIQQSPLLREWWEKQQSCSKGCLTLDQVIDKVREAGAYFGDEIVLTVQSNSQGIPEAPLVIAALKDPTGFKAYLREQLASINQGGKNDPHFKLIDDPAMVVEETPERWIYIYIHGDILAASTKVASLQALEAGLKTPGSGVFASSALHNQIADVYREGAGIIVAADLQKIISSSVQSGPASPGKERRTSAAQRLGLLSLRHFILQVKDIDGKPQTRAVLSFSEPKQGIPSWLASPGPMGSLEFISPDATIVGAFVVKQPAALIDELLGAIGTLEPGLKQELDTFKNSTGLDIRDDIAAPLGGEFAFAIDGPILPKPSWKLIFEVKDANHLQNTIEQLLVKMNEIESAHGAAKSTLNRENVNGHTFYTLKCGTGAVEVHYAYEDGYLIAAPNRGLVDQSLRYHQSETSLLMSARFKAILPADGNASFSAILYQNLAPIFGPLAKFGGTAGNLTPENQAALNTMAEIKPSLGYVYAREDRIIIGSSSEDGVFGLSPSSLLGMPGSFGLQSLMRSSIRK